LISILWITKKTTGMVQPPAWSTFINTLMLPYTSANRTTWFLNYTAIN
jgi:hypothetical protein